MIRFRKTYTSLSDEELMQALVKGKEKAFDELYSRYGDRLHYYFYRMLGKDTEVANDFTQDLFMRVIEKGDRFDPKQRFATWLYAIASNMCKNEYRRRKHRAGVELPIPEQAFQREGFYLSTEADRELFAEQLQKALNTLEEKHRTCFVLRFQQELSIKDISAIMDCPEGTVKSRIYYTLRKLSQLLQVFHPNHSKKKRYEKQTR